MKVIRLKTNPKVYSSNAYLILGSWNRIEDVNTLIDVGLDGFISKDIAEISTGVGKKPVEQIILTHGHFDHVAGLKEVNNVFNATVYAFNPSGGVAKILIDGQIILCGDAEFEVIYTPGHSQDSICLYNQIEGILFSGDIPIQIRTSDGSYSVAFVSAFEKLARRNIKIIYPGHGEPIVKNASEMIRDSLSNIRKSQLVF